MCVYILYAKAILGFTMDLASSIQPPSLSWLRKTF